jgi:DNA-binding response OmpR family regulator
MKKQNKILVIEDQAGLRDAVVQLLKIQKYEVYEAENGLTGFNAILSLQPDVVICDVQMPKLNGYGVLRCINELVPQDRMPSFLFLTSRCQQEDIDKGLKLGADDYIIKPFILEDLLGAIRKSLKKNDQRQNAKCDLN